MLTISRLLNGEFDNLTLNFQADTVLRLRLSLAADILHDCNSYSEDDMQIIKIPTDISGMIKELTISSESNKPSPVRWLISLGYESPVKITLKFLSNISVYFGYDDYANVSDFTPCLSNDLFPEVMTVLENKLNT